MSGVGSSVLRGNSTRQSPGSSSTGALRTTSIAPRRLSFALQLHSFTLTRHRHHVRCSEIYPTSAAQEYVYPLEWTEEMGGWDASDEIMDVGDAGMFEWRNFEMDWRDVN